jgi:hypothetical protein
MYSLRRTVSQLHNNSQMVHNLFRANQENYLLYENDCSYDNNKFSSVLCVRSLYSIGWLQMFRKL